MIFTVDFSLSFSYGIKRSSYIKKLSVEEWGRSNGFCHGPYTPYLYNFLLFLEKILPNNLTPENLKSLRIHFYNLLINFSERFDQLVSLPIIYMNPRSQFSKSLSEVEEKEFKAKVFPEKNRKKLNNEVKTFRKSMGFFLSSFQQKFGYPFEAKKLKVIKKIKDSSYSQISLSIWTTRGLTTKDLFRSYTLKVGGLNRKRQIINGKQTILPLLQEISSVDSIVEQNLEVINEYIKIIEQILFDDKTSLKEIEENIDTFLTKGKKDFEEIAKMGNISQHTKNCIIEFSTKLSEVIRLDKCIRDGLFSEKFASKEEENDTTESYLLGKILIIMRVYITHLCGIPCLYPYKLLLKEELAKAYDIRCNCSSRPNKIRRSIPNKKAIVRELEDQSVNKLGKLPWYIWDLFQQCTPCSYVKDLNPFKLNSYNRNWTDTIKDMD